MARLYALLAILATLLIFHAPPSFAENHRDKDHDRKHHHGSPSPAEPYKVLKEFCHRQSDAKFCSRALRRDPRAADAEDLIGLLKISVDLAVEKANKTHHFLTSMVKKKEIAEHGFLEAMRECTAAYDECLRELQIIPSELRDDVALASYDALMAHDALDTCQASLNKGKINNRGIVTRHRLSVDYVRLCVDIARAL